MAPSQDDVYCAGIVTTEPPPMDTYVISGVESSLRIVYSTGDLVFINRGANQGVRAGAEFLVSRPMDEPLKTPWFGWQKGILRVMGQTYADVGRLRVVHAQGDVSTAEIVHSCLMMERGDIVRPFAARPAPPFKPVSALDMFAPPSGREQAMVVTTRGFGQVASAGSVVYVNLGTSQGVRVGNYFRVFRYQGGRNETVYQVRGMENRVWGFGSAPERWRWMDLPRDILGEGIVLNVSPNAATVLLTDSKREIFPGDYVELE
jgi:hypothetical protein